MPQTSQAFAPTGLAVHGTNTNDDAAAGYVGEYLSVSGTNVNFPTSTQFGDMGSLALTPGDWDISLVAAVGDNSATITNNEVTFGISTTTGNSSTGLVSGDNQVQVANNTISNSPQPGTSIPNWRLKLTANTTVYAKYTAAYSGGPPQASFRLSARRIR